MRPRRLVSVRAKQGRRLSSHGFRTVDLSVLLLVTAVMCDRTSPASLLDTPVRELLPLVSGALVLARTLQSLRLYRFVRSEGVVAHFGRLLVACVVADLAGLLTYFLVDDGHPVRACWGWAILAGRGGQRAG